jgi:hypothetical protein
MTKLKESSEKNKTFKGSKPIYPYNIHCKVKAKNEVYIDPYGIVMPCCWLGLHIRKIYTDFYINGNENNKPKLDVKYNGRGKLTTWFYEDFSNMIEAEGGITAFSLNHNSLENILTNEFYMHKLEDLWEDISCQFCAHYCGQNKEGGENYQYSKIQISTVLDL